MAAAADKNKRCVWTDEETSTFLDLVQETSINTILDGKQQRLYLCRLITPSRCSVFLCCGKLHLTGECAPPTACLQLTPGITVVDGNT